jgi:hypothetical protein
MNTELHEHARTLVRAAEKPDNEFHTSFLLGRAIGILQGLVESPTDALDIQLAQDLLADYRKWMDR